MTTFDQLWDGAVTDARGQLLPQDPVAAGLADRIRRPSFPAALALLADPQRPGARRGPEFLSTIAASAAETDESKTAGLDADAIESVLRALFVKRTIPSATGRSNDELSLVLQQALARQQLFISDDEAREIVQILETGQFYGDIMSSAGAVFHTIPALPADLLKDIPRLPGLPVAATGTLLDGVLGLIGALPKVTEDLRDGRVDEPPEVMTSFLAVLYGFATVDRIRDLVRRLLDPKNRSVRLALLLYARSNGFDLDEADLDTVHRELLDTSDPDLGPVLATALEVMKRRYHGEELETALAALQRGNTLG